MITDVYFYPNGNVEAYAEAQTHRIKKKNNGRTVTKIKVAPAFPVRMLSGSYSEVKFKLIPAINSCQPEVHGISDGIKQMQRDMIRFCQLRGKKRERQVQEEEQATEAAQAVVPNQT
jgi:hypothetical protein